jgi:plasmid stabilization system protein ParE
MIGYRFLPPAEEEMAEASFYYETASGGLGQEFLDDLQYTVDALRRHPELGRSVGGELRQAPLRRFPVLSIYIHSVEEIIVVA